MLQRKRGTASTTLAFIDVMSCGLGATILLFFLLDFSVPAETEDESIPVPVVDSFQDIRELEAERIGLAGRVESGSDAVALLKKQVSDKLVRTATSKALLAQQVNVQSAPELPEKVVKDRESTGELIGLSIQGRRILILFDVSASMAYTALIDIISGISDKSGARLRAGPKWAQAKRVVLWALENAPSDSQVQVLAYSDTVTRITQRWSSPKEALIEFQKQKKTFFPNGGTSLGKVLEFVDDNGLGATDIYVITDGLPTIAGNKRGALGVLSGCFASPSAKVVYVDGKCRVALFSKAVKRFEKGSNANINIVLLPLEGDPQAAPHYWAWASANKGTLFSPAWGWP